MLHLDYAVAGISLTGCYEVCQGDTRQSLSEHDPHQHNFALSVKKKEGCSSSSQHTTVTRKDKTNKENSVFTQVRYRVAYMERRTVLWCNVRLWKNATCKTLVPIQLWI